MSLMSLVPAKAEPRSNRSPKRQKTVLSSYLQANRMKKSLFVAFAIASAIPVTVWPLGGLAIASARANSDLDFSFVAIILPVLFGLYNAATVLTGMRRTRLTMLLAGALLGLVLASIGSYLGIPQRVYGLSEQSKWLVLIGGPIFYALVWGFALLPLERLVAGNSEHLSSTAN